MQTGQWVRQGSTITLDNTGPSAGPSPENELFLSDLYSNLSGWAKQGASYIGSGFGSPAVVPTQPRTAPSAPPRAAPTAPTPRSETRLPVPESALSALLPVFSDYTYNFQSVRYPWAIPGVSLPLAPPKLINCCTFVEALVVRAWANTHGAAFLWNSRRHSQMMISTGDDLFSPVTAVIESEMGTAVPAGQPPTAWCVAQGWRTSTSGHTFIILARHAPSDRVLTLEANQAYSLNGVGYRKLGNLRDFPGCRPPARWWENSAAPLWRDIVATYANGLKLAKLNVLGPSWAGLPA